MTAIRAAGHVSVYHVKSSLWKSSERGLSMSGLGGNQN